jgi:flagellar hook protein FlgE
MFASIDIGLSGMDAYSKGLQVISNNVTNLNTPGYKSNSVTFADVFNNRLGEMGFSSGGPGQDASGNGVRVGPSQINFAEGTLQQTSGDLDLAIQGAGFFVLSDGSRTSYARTGSFGLDTDGFLSLQGTKLHLEVLNASAQTSVLNLKDKRTSAPTTTTKVTFADNLSSSGGSDTISNIKVFDSAGAQHIWQLALTADAQNPGSWNAKVTDETGATVGTGVLKFLGSSIDPSTAQLTITTTPAGASQMSVVMDFSGVTSFSSGTTSTLQVTASDGNALGALSSVTVDSAGVVTLTYSNSKTLQEGSLALADFDDPQQLTQQSGGQFVAPADARVRYRASGQDGIGTIVSKQIEASNVDLSSEFGQLIIIQRGFQASSQVVSVANDMIQQLFGIRGQ